MKDMKWLWRAVLLAGLAAGPGLADPNTTPAQDENVQPMEHKGFGRGLAAELGLSEEKAAEIKNLMHETRKIMIKLKADRDLAKADLEHLFTADTLDEKAITAAADKLAQINADMTRAQVKARLAVNSALTPEQRARMHELRQGTMQKFKERKEGRRNQGRERRSQRSDRSEDGPESGGGEPESEGGGF